VAVHSIHQRGEIAIAATGGHTDLACNSQASILCAPGESLRQLTEHAPKQKWSAPSRPVDPNWLRGGATTVPEAAFLIMGIMARSAAVIETSYLSRSNPNAPAIPQQPDFMIS